MDENAASVPGNSRAEPTQVRRMFDAISPRYDLMNTVMTGGLHHRWRRLAARATLPRPGLLALDVGCGTGDMALALRAAGARAVVGVDIAPAMLRHALRKLDARGETGVTLLLGDALRLPFRDGTFDATATAFTLRNTADVHAALAEMRRVVRPGGRVVVLEGAETGGGPAGRAARLYLHRVVPLLGGIIAGAPRAYRYLPRSMSEFLAPDALADVMRAVGLRGVRYRVLMLGTVTVHVAAV